MHRKTLLIIDAAYRVLAEHHPMTVRQVFYQLVSRQVVKNSRSRYQTVSNALRDARKERMIPWGWIEDRTRRARDVAMWDGLPSFADAAVASYRRDAWADQPQLVEVWLEKDALSGIFEEVLDPYGVTLNVGRGYDGWSSIHLAARRYEDGELVTVLYFGDFDPSGEDMLRSLRDRVGFFNCEPRIVKVALTPELITEHDLPPDFTKPTDTRQAKFVAEHGDVSVELDALPVEVLREMLVDAVEAEMDLDALEATKDQEEKDRTELRNLLNGNDN